MIKTIIVDDVQESRNNVERLLRFESDIQIVGSVGSGREAIDLVRDKQPDIVLMDVNMPEIDGIAATREIVSKRPNTGVVMMSVLNEPDILRRSMLAGAREFLVKPFSMDELLSGIRTVHEMVESLPSPTVQVVAPIAASPVENRQPGRAIITSVVGSKGGIGRSVVASNFAVALKVATGKRVALVDTNSSAGDIAVLMNVTEGKTILDAVQYQATIDTELVGTILEEHGSGVEMLLAPTSPQDAEIVTPELIHACVTVMMEMFDYIVIDTRPGFDELNLALFDISDFMLLLVTMDMTAIKDARHFIEITDLLEYSGDRVRVVLNRQNNYSGIPAEELGESLRRELWAQIEDEPGPVQRSVNEGVPLVTGNVESKAAIEIERMVVEFLNEVDPESLAARGSDIMEVVSSSLVGRLKVALRSAS